MTVIHQLSPVGIARRRLAEATQAAEEAATVLPPLEQERATAQARLNFLEALPVDLRKPDRDRELEIASLRRGLGQLQTRIDTATREYQELDADRKRAVSAAGSVNGRLSEVERKLALLADLSHPEVQTMRIMDHQQFIRDHERELRQLTSAPASTAAVQAVAQAA